MYVYIWLTHAFVFSSNTIIARLLYFDSKKIVVSLLFIWEQKYILRKLKV